MRIHRNFGYFIATRVIQDLRNYIYIQNAITLNITLKCLSRRFQANGFLTNHTTFPFSTRTYPTASTKSTRTPTQKNYFLSFNIYYTDLSYMLIEEHPFWDVFLLFSSIGGNLGLFVGMSFLSFVEIFELAFLFLEFLFISRFSKRNS